MAQKVYKFGFYAMVETLRLGLKFPCCLSIIWKRGEKLAEVKERRQIMGGVATFNEALTIECNMVFDGQKKLFEEKITLFSVLIFTQKGTKQAGQVEVDVSDMLNKRQQERKYELPLQKCPDKNALLTFKIKPYLKEEIKADTISERSLRNVDLQKVAGTINSNSSAPQPPPPASVASFKKKPKVEEPLSNQQNRIKPTKSMGVINDNDQKQAEENKRLRDEIKQLRRQNERLKKVGEKSNATVEECKQKVQQLKGQLSCFEEASKTLKTLEKTNKTLQKEVMECRLKLGSIFNRAFQIGGPELTDQLQEACGYTEIQFDN